MPVLLPALSEMLMKNAEFAPKHQKFGGESEIFPALSVGLFNAGVSQAGGGSPTILSWHFLSTGVTKVHQSIDKFYVLA